MRAIAARKLAKDTLVGLGIVTKFRGETLPTSGPHAVIDVILESPLTTWDLDEAGSLITLQIGYWAGSPLSNASDIFDLANPELATLGFFRGFTRSLVEDNWSGIQADYEYLQE